MHLNVFGGAITPIVRQKVAYDIQTMCMHEPHVSALPPHHPTTSIYKYIQFTLDSIRTDAKFYLYVYGILLLYIFSVTSLFLSLFYISS